jgi:thymidylate kinase
MSRALLICLSGIESSGKSTQIEGLMESARRTGRRPIHLWTRPGYTRNLEAAKRLARRLAGSRGGGRKVGAAERAPRSYPRRAEGFRGPFQRHVWLSLALIDLIWAYGFQIRLWRAMGRTVICDRYIWDCVVDFRVNFPEDAVESRLLFRLLRALSPTPDAAFFLLLPVAESVRRSQLRERRFREADAVLERRREAYESLALETGWPVLDGRRPAEELAEEIRSRVAAVTESAPQPGT